MPKRPCRINLFVLALTISMAAALLPVGAFAQEGVFSIEIAPPVIRFDSQIRWLTVHADLPYRLIGVDMPVLLSLEGGENTISAKTISQDAKGNLVATFALEDIQNFLNLKVGKQNTFVLECFLVNGEPLTGKQEIRVVQNAG